MPDVATAGLALGGVQLVSGLVEGNKAGKAANRAAGAQERIADEQVRQLQQQWDEYVKIYQPIAEEFSKQTMARAKPDYGRLESETAATFDAQADRSRAITGRALAANMVNPGSEASTAALARIGAAEAPARASAITTARRDAEDRAYAAVTGGTQIGKGMPAAITSGMSGPASIYGNAANRYSDQAGQAGYVFGRGIDTVGTAVGKWFGQTQPAAPIIDHSINSGINTGVNIPTMADGGAIRGPGDGTSDSIKAINVNNGERLRVSDGEFIMPADVVKWKGEEFFHKLIEKYHRPSPDAPPSSMVNGGAITRPRPPGLPKNVMRAIYAEMPSARRH